MKHHSLIEPLEDRIAPATILNPYTVTYQDLDVVNGSQVTGSTVIVKISHPLFKTLAAAERILQFTDANGNSVNETFSDHNSTGEFLRTIDLLGSNGKTLTAAQDMNLSVKVIPQLGIGSPTVNVGSILAANFSADLSQVTQNIDLGAVSIQGNLGQIWVGDRFSTPALKSLTVGSMGDVTVGPDILTLPSYVLGPIVKMNVEGDFSASMKLIGFQFGKIDNLNIGGSLAGDVIQTTSGLTENPNTGFIQFSGRIGSATIGNIVGSAAANTGELIGSSLIPNTSIGSLHVTGSISGGAGQDSGRVFTQSTLGKVKVDGSVTGGAGQDSGEIAGALGMVSIAGNLTGGAGISSGAVMGEAMTTAATLVPVSIGSVTIGGNVTGGSAGVAAVPATSTTAIPGDSGIISAFTARSISIGGSLIGGTAGTGTNSSGTLDQTADTSGAILVNSVTSLSIGKDITGGSGPNSGIITANILTLPTSYANIVIADGLTGGAGATSGAILADSATSIIIGKSITGGSGANSGEISGRASFTNITATNYSSIVVDGDVAGGSGTGSGAILANSIFGGTITNLTIGGSVTGGTANDTGYIFSGGNLTNATIDGNLTGNTTINSATAVVGSGYIQASHIANLKIVGNVTSGANSGGKIANSGAIRSAGDIVSLTIEGLVTGTSANPVIISAQSGTGGSATPPTDLAIQTVKIDQAATYLDILAGYSPTVSTGSGSTADPAGAPLGTPVDGSAQIGTVTFGSTLSASNIAAGAEPGASGFFGNADNKAAPKTGTLHSSIASIIVTGQATGDSTPTDSFGFVAENLLSVKVNGVIIPTNNLTPGTPVAINGTNLYLLEVP